MKVAELSVSIVRIPLRRPIRHASHQRTQTDNLVARCVLADGTVGHGEGVPRDYVTGETVDSALALLQRSDLSAQLDACADFAAAVALAGRLRLADVAGDERGVGGNAARCAVELAVLDAYGRHFGQPLSQVTQLAAPDCCAPRPWVRYSGAITSAQGLKLRLRALVQWLYGFRQIKLKVGIAGQDDVRRLAALRRCVGARVDLRVDANEAWPPGEAADRIRALAPFGITAVEQPVAHEHVGCLVEVRRQTGVPIMLDESLCGPADAERAAREGLADLFNVRLSKCGGFLPSLGLVRLARRHGLGYQLGCQVGETAILSAAGRHFASSVDGIRYLEGSYDRHLVREALGSRDITFGLGGKAPALTGGGLGIDVDPRALARVTLRAERLV